MSGYLDRINEANDIKKIEPEAYDALASEIRSFIIESVSEHGGHLASNLGVVESDIAKAMGQMIRQLYRRRQVRCLSFFMAVQVFLMI